MSESSRDSSSSYAELEQKGYTPASPDYLPSDAEEELPNYSPASPAYFEGDRADESLPISEESSEDEDDEVEVIAEFRRDNSGRLWRCRSPIYLDRD